jgi:hypothetical protein
MALGYGLAANAFFDGRIDRDALHERFKIGIAGRDGLGV